jgi:hypothetical protein
MAAARAEIHNPLLRASRNGFALAYDILCLTSWMLIRSEEVNPPADLLDSHGRFPATSSHTLHQGHFEWPIVDEWLGVLRQLLQRLWLRLELQQHQFRTVVSHDWTPPVPTASGASARWCAAWRPGYSNIATWPVPCKLRVSAWPVAASSIPPIRSTPLSG